MVIHNLLNAIFPIIGAIFITFIVAIIIAAIVRTVMKNNAKEITVHATVCDKHKGQRFSKYAGGGTVEEYFVVFDIGGQKKRFLVSDFSYAGYNINDTGSLTYQGNRLIKFK